jgi:diguanylate cyclase (GGDEF)-like protein
LVRPAIPSDEDERLAALMSVGILHTQPEERFDRITRLASELLGTPVAMVSLVDRDHQWFKSVHGLDVSGVPRDDSFCGHAILADEPLVVEDALSDDRFVDNPFVTSGPRIRAYAGQPIRVGAGHRVGTLCVVDTRPRPFSEHELQNLRDLAAIVEDEIQRGMLHEIRTELLSQRDELERKAMIDALTRIWNRGAIMEILQREIARARRGTPVSLAMIDADHFKLVNDTYGHPVGDQVLAELAQRTRRAVRDCDEVGRYGGEEFIVLLSGCDARFAHIAGERIRAAVARDPFTTTAGPLEVSVSIGMATFTSGHHTSSDDLIADCDRALYAAKAGGRNRVEMA